ncbi:type II secretion system F family protein [Natronospirillum operosum]|uniref:Type II secretion system F family protein n=1 Tax=Natronospirillum operosum TaxID=2759953 RepID=A0A4Z0WCN7_9GAMM|nr:type II secretion system F family protein [Natronospirillum operosum]TGG92344.1 type II secretion system F family protein [Natronospirillum operosum]
MPNFAYRGRTQDGQAVNDIIEARSMDQAADELKRLDIMPLSIEPTNRKPRGSNEAADWRKLFWPQITSDDLILFCRQMYALTRSGIPLMRAVNGLAEASQNKRLCDILREVSRSLTGGNDLATALSRHPRVFSPLFVAMISMGETTGQLDTAFKQLIDHLELEKNTQRQIKQATRYPTFVVFAITAAMVVINFMVIPSFANVFQRMGEDLPIFTIILLRTSEFLTTFGLFILAGLVALYVAWRRYITTPQGRYQKDRWLLRLPLVGHVFRRIAMSRFTRPFAMMLDAGVPLLQALNITSRTVGNEYIGRRIDSMQSGIERGESILATARTSGMFNPLILQMIGVGEETGNLSDMLRDVADFYDQEIEYELKTLSQSIEPLLIVMMGGIVVMLALGIFLPMWDLAGGAGGL